jgi:hypothetical protein
MALSDGRSLDVVVFMPSLRGKDKLPLIDVSVLVMVLGVVIKFYFLSSLRNDFWRIEVLRIVLFKRRLLI